MRIASTVLKVFEVGICSIFFAFSKPWLSDEIIFQGEYLSKKAKPYEIGSELIS